MTNNWKKEILPLLPESVKNAIDKLSTSVVCSITEIRLRAGGYTSLTVGYENKPLYLNKEPIILSSRDLYDVFIVEEV